jgi:transglutaminase/protease-like cytokinesis protein 3
MLPKVVSSMIFVLVLYASSARGQLSDFAGTDFRKADSVAAVYAGHSLMNMKILANKLTLPLSSEQEKYRAIFKWVCENIEVDYDLLLLNKYKRKKLHGEKLRRWNEKLNRMVYDKLLYERRTLCTGYAYVIRELCFLAGLECEIVNGYGKPGGIGDTTSFQINHSWNRIRLNGKWYWTDATWSSGIYNRTTQTFVKKYNEKYFLPDPQTFSVDHQIINSPVQLISTQNEPTPAE